MITNQTYKYWILSGKKNDGTEVNAKELKLWKEFDKLMNKKGVSLISLIIAAIVITLLAATAALNSEKTIDNAYESMFYNEISDIQDSVTRKRNENMVQGEVYTGFKKVKINNAPSDFVSVDEDITTGIYGYLIEPSFIGVRDNEWGKEYSKFTGPNAEVTFKIDDVYAFDGKGEVYYLFGFTNDEESDDRIYKLN